MVAAGPPDGCGQICFVFQFPFVRLFSWSAGAFLAGARGVCGAGRYRCGQVRVRKQEA